MSDAASPAHRFRQQSPLLTRWFFSSRKRLVAVLFGVYALVLTILNGVHLLHGKPSLPSLPSRQEWIRAGQNNAEREASKIIKRRKDHPYRDLQSWEFSPSKARSVQKDFLQATRRPTPLLEAFLEPPLPPPPSQNTSDSSIRIVGPELPSRTNNTPSELKHVTYPRAGPSCQNYQATLPVSHPVNLDDKYGSNVFNTQSLHSLRFQYADHPCGTPVHADPFLPWIHDVFTSNDGKFVNIIAHNKRLCNTDPKHFGNDLKALESQHSLWQPVPIQRVEGVSGSVKDGDGEQAIVVDGAMVHRYRLTSHEKADADGKETRFICRFYSYASNGKLQKVILGETLSTYPYNPERAHFLKPSVPGMVLPPDHMGIKQQIWNTILHAKCPIPDIKINVLPSENHAKLDSRLLSSLISSGESVVDGLPTIFFDLIPIRTYPRTSKEESYIQGVKSQFDPKVEWGDDHILPPVEASGRWSAIPVCSPPSKGERISNDITLGKDINMESYRKKKNDLAVASDGPNNNVDETDNLDPPKKYYLTACVWSSASFHTRGSKESDNSTALRLLEWLTYNLYIAGFDHVYVYDNSGAFADDFGSEENTMGDLKAGSKGNSDTFSSLKVITDLFPPSKVTRIPWPHRVCNNNRPMNSNPGERSSQYAAEASCRVRYGNLTTWMATLDVDEYLVPAGRWMQTDSSKGDDNKYVGIQKWLRSLDSKKSIDKAYILSFYQTRSLPDIRKMVPRVDNDGREVLDKNSTLTYLETYDCDPTKLPKPSYGWRAQKQIYKPEFVLNHYVHYSTVTDRINTNPGELSPRFIQKQPWERRVNELDEAFLLHTKTTRPDATIRWRLKCSNATEKGNCPVGVPHMDNWGDFASDEYKKITYSDNNDLTGLGSVLIGLRPNCYRHKIVRQSLVTRVENAMKPYQDKYKQRLQKHQ